MLLIIITVLLVALFATMKMQHSNWKRTALEYFLFIVYFISFLIFFFAYASNSSAYTSAIDPIDNGYSPFGVAQMPSLMLYLIMFWVSGILLWLSENKLSPLIKVIAPGFLCIGMVISTVGILQVIDCDSPQTRSAYRDPALAYMLSFYQVLNIVISIVLINKSITTERLQAEKRSYKNKVPDLANKLLIKINHNPLWLGLALLPVLLVCTLILILFGQSPDSLIKAFTHTTTWRFSQMSHPDYLPHQGHYLCTVAARGSRKIVKPLRTGQRNGKNIIVNRQLLIANAFEEIIQNKLPQTHRIIRSLYDNFGLPLSKYINTPRRSNITYILMKPLEWLFLLFIYLFCISPEENINRQYAAKIETLPYVNN